ncbi:hypothetical protein ACYX8G_19690 [Microbacterium saperdae]
MNATSEIFATLEGITFEGGDGDSPYTIIPDGLKGWFEGVDTRRENIDRLASHGQFLTPGYLSGRLVTIDGEIYTADYREQEIATDRLRGLLAGGGTGQLTVTTGLRSTYATVQRNGAPTIRLDRWGLLATYQVQFWAVDPRRYSVDMESTGPASSITVTNEGNIEALPVLHITGAAAGGYTISGPGGKLIVVSRPLVSGVPHRFEMRTARLYVGGTQVVGGVSRADLFDIPPARPTGTQLSVSAGALLRAEVRHTFI